MVSGNFAKMMTSTPFRDLLYVQIYDVGPTAYVPSEGRCAEDFFALKNPTASAGFELVNLGIKV